MLIDFADKPGLLRRKYFHDHLESQDVIEQRAAEKSNADPRNPLGNPPEFFELNGGRSLKTRPGLAKDSMEKAGYLCELDQTHFTFVAATTGRNYVEVHHLIPKEYQDEFPDQTLDVQQNIVVLCPTCHRLLHSAERHDKETYLHKLFQLRGEGLRSAGLPVSLRKLFKYYD